jgi:hypothetical protein
VKSQVSGCFRIETPQQALAQLETGHALGGNRDPDAVARIAPGPRVARAGVEDAEAAQLDPPARGKLTGNRGEDGRDDMLCLAARQAGIGVEEQFNQFGSDHGPTIAC